MDPIQTSRSERQQVVKCSASRARRRRRLRLKDSKNNNVWKLLHTNIRGFASKKISLDAIINNIKPSVVTINETKAKSKNNVKIRGFSCFSLNRNCEEGGGVATCVNNAERFNALKIHEGSKGKEMLVTRHSQFQNPINIINIYGLVESRSCQDLIDEQWSAIMDQVAKIEALGEWLILIGDLNSHVGELINNNKDKISYGGKLIRDFVMSGDYILVNSTEKNHQRTIY